MPVSINLNEKLTAKICQQLMPNISERSAYYYMNQLRTSLKKDKPKLLLVSDLVDYFGIESSLIIKTDDHEKI